MDMTRVAYSSGKWEPGNFQSFAYKSEYYSSSDVMQLIRKMLYDSAERKK